MSFNSSMATIVSLSSSLLLSQKPMTLSFSYGISSDKLSHSNVKFGTMKQSRSVSLVSVCRAASVVFRDLDADDFRHPLDKQNTLLLRAIPGLNDLGRAVLGTVTEQIMLLENIGTSVLVSKNQVYTR